MEPLFHFALALLNASAPWLEAMVVVAIAWPAPDRTYADNTAAPRLPE